MNVIKGKVLEGEYKGKDILIMLGDAGYNTKIYVGDTKLKGVQKINILVDVASQTMIEIVTR